MENILSKANPVKSTLILVLMLCIYVASSSEAAYAPGVPDPLFGLNETAPTWPDGWPSSSVVNHYYIDNNHVQATDTGNTYGFPDKPRLTIPEIEYPEGAYIEIHNGPYDGGGQVILSANGTKNLPVWVRGVSDADRATITGEVILKGRYIILENLHFRDTGRLGLRSHNSSSLSNAIIRNSEFSGSNINVGNSAAIGVSGQSSSNRFNHIVIYNNHIHDLGDYLSSSENDFHGIAVVTNADHVWVLDNHVYHMAGDSIQIGTASTANENRVSHIYVSGNTFHEDRENAVDIKESDNVVISSNTLWGYKHTSSSSGEVLVIHNEADNIWVINNTVYNGNYGLLTSGSTNTWFIGNLIYNIHHDPEMPWDASSGYSSGTAIHFRGNSDGGVVNNTIFGYDNGIQLTQGNGVGYSIYNNILSERVEPDGVDIRSPNSTVSDSIAMDNNIIYHSTSSPAIYWEGYIFSVNEFKNTYEICNNCVSSDPFFVDQTAIDLSIKPYSIEANITSPAMNTGVLHPAYSTFDSIFGESILFDMTGRAKPSGKSMEIGSFEIVAPSPPDNVSVIRSN